MSCLIGSPTRPKLVEEVATPTSRDARASFFFFLFSSLTFPVRPAKRRRRCPQDDPVYFLFFFCRGRKEEEEQKKKSWRPPSFLMIFQKGLFGGLPISPNFRVKVDVNVDEARGEEDGIRTKRLPW